MDWGQIMTTLAISGIIALAGVLGTLLTLVWKSYKKIQVIESRGKLRHGENKLQFKAIFTLIKCVRTGSVNGELMAVEKELNDYLQEQAVR